MKRTGRIISLLVLAGAAVVAITSFSNAAGGGGGPQLCPDIYAPVICDGGKIYPNQCYADRQKAKNCRPYGDI